MAQENINPGAFPNDPEADPVRTAFLKTQNNFTDIYKSVLTTGVTKVISGNGLAVNRQTGEVTISANISKVTVNTDQNILVGIGTATTNTATAINANNVLSFKLADTLTTSNIVAANLIGTIRTASQPIITSVGTLDKLTLLSTGQGITTPSVTANTITSNLITGNSISAPGGHTQVLLNYNSVIRASSNLTFDGNILNVIGNVTSRNANLGNLAVANYITGTLTTISQPNITTVGDLTNLSVVGNTSVGSNLVVTGNSQVSNVNISGTIAGNLIPSTTVFYDIGSNTNRYRDLYLSGNAVFLGNQVMLSAANLGTMTIVGNVSTGNNITSNNLIVGNIYASADASVTGNLSVNNIFANAGTVKGNLLSGTITTSAQPNITTVGQLISLNVLDNFITGNANLGNSALANYFFGNGSGLTSLRGNMVTGQVNFAAVANAVAGANVNGQVAAAAVAGTVYSPAQSNITSVGTLTSLNVSGTIQSSQLQTIGLTANSNVNASYFNASSGVVIGNVVISATTITAPQFIGSGNTLTSINGSNVSGNVNSSIISYNSNINPVNQTDTSAYVLNMTSGTVGNLKMYGSNSLSYIPNTNTLSTGVLIANSEIVTPRITVTNTANFTFGNLLVNGFIKSDNYLESGFIKSLTNLQVVGNTSTGNLTSTGGIFTNGNVNGGNINVTGSVKTSTITTGNAFWFGTITGNWSLSPGSRLTATFADLAEVYAGDRYIAPGTVVDFDGPNEVIESYRIMSSKVAGVVSTDPAYVLNSAMNCEFPTMVALQGRVPCKVIGKVRKGDMMISAGGGVARAEENPKVGTVIGKSLENFDGDIGVIEIAIGRF